MYKLVKDSTIFFQCNICEGISKQKISILAEREVPSCNFCGSTLRFRSVINALSICLFGDTITLPNFKNNKKIKGVGLSEWSGFSKVLEEKFDFINTFFHQEPFLDITSPPTYLKGQIDFVISSEVFEHVPPPVGKAFEGAFNMLKPGGILILTVPFRTDIEYTIEHFPNLYNYEILDHSGVKILKNQTKDGNEEIFSNLIFHGGVGTTLEMRVFSKKSIENECIKAGFRLIRFFSESFPEYGIIWQGDWSVPIVGIKPSY